MATKRIRLPGPPPIEASGSTPLTIEFPAEQPFLPTREHARFVEFAEACGHYRYIGVCHGRPGVGKTRSARKFASLPNLQGYGAMSPIAPALAEEIARCRAMFYTVSVSNTPKAIDQAMGVNLTKLGYARMTIVAGSVDDVDHDAARMACPLVIVDEADRLTIKSLEHLRDMADRRGFGLILMGMPGLEKRLARYAQLYSRIGFVHEFKPLTETEMRFLLATHVSNFGITFDPTQLDAIEAQAAVIRITRGNFRLMERLFAQMRRIMTLNRVDDVSPDIVQAARDCLVIGPGN
ncbi:ATP-binding protein [Sphingomonas sp. ABOLD]|uniref:AAA family ATPase n=1 Tax=unclassified Sphingomonas TaxID=196159 RepID=UPI000F7EF493|nr:MULTISPECIES: ATP-binding protein [unclassified Sphingomonas]RSV51570.1 ATP-binding protein [Sphingomonas sp. ABOLD]